MTEYQPSFHNHQIPQNEEILIVDPPERQRSVNSQNRSYRRQSERGRSSSRKPQHTYTHNLHNSSPGASSAHDPISLSSDESPPERRPRKRAATVLPPDHRSSKRVHRAGSVFPPGHAPQANTFEYQNTVQMRDINMHCLNSPIGFQSSMQMSGNRTPRPQGNFRQQNRPNHDSLIRELQRQRGGIFTEAAGIQDRLDHINAEERRLQQEMGQRNDGSRRNSVSIGSHGSINGTVLSSPSRHGAKASSLGMHGSNAQSPIANGSHHLKHSPGPSMNLPAHRPNGQAWFGSPTPSQAGQQNGFQRLENASSPRPRLAPAIWEGESIPQPHPVEFLRERTSQATQGPRGSNTPQRTSRAQSVAFEGTTMAFKRGRSVVPAAHQNNAGGGSPMKRVRRVNKLTGDWADSSDDDESHAPPKRFQRASTVAPSSRSHGFSQFGNGAQVQGMSNQTLPRGQTAARETHIQGDNHMVNGMHSQTPQGRRFQRGQSEVPETPRSNTQIKQPHSNSTNFATPLQYPQPPSRQFDFFKPLVIRSPKPPSGPASMVDDPLPPPPPTPGSDHGSMRELMHKAKFQSRNGMIPAKQYVNDVPKQGMKFKARKKAPPPITPNTQIQVIDLISPDGSEIRLQPFPVPPIVERPMKERVTPASKPGARKRGKSVAPGDDPRTDEQKRQERAAKIIAEQERQGAEREIFGDDIQSIDEAKKKVQEERERLEEKKRQREREEAEKRESGEVAARKILLVQQEKAEQEELRKQLAESRNKIRRERIRQKAEHEEAEAREERREAAAAKIEADRKTAEAAKLEREKKKRMETDVQVQPRALQQTKAKQETLKKQVANIKASKVSSDDTDSSLVCLGEKTIPEADKTTQNAGTQEAGKSADTSKGKEIVNDNANANANASSRKEVFDVESGLFVPANVPPSQDGTEVNTTALAKDKQPLVFERNVGKNLYDSDQRRFRGKSLGPTTAAEYCAIAQGQQSKRLQSYREVREREIEARRCQEKLQSRIARREREKSAPPPPTVPKRPEPKAARPIASQNEPRKPAKPRATKASGKSAEQELSSAIFPKFMPSAPAPPIANKGLATIAKEPAAPIVSKPAQGVVVISDEERARIDAQHKKKAQLEQEKQAAAKAEQKKLQTLEHNKKNRERATRQAREKERLRLIAEAEESGVELSPMELISKVEDYMEKRERKMAKTAATRAMHEQIKNLGADDLAIAQQASQAAAASQANKNIDREDDPNDDSPAALELRAKRKAMQETLNTIGQNRRSQQSQPIRMTCADESDTGASIESEEDPDPDLDPASSSNSSDDEGASQSSHTMSGKSNSNLENSQIGTQIEQHSRSIPGPGKNKRRAPPRPIPTVDPENSRNMYSVEEKYTKGGITYRHQTRNLYFNLDDAETAAKDLANRYREIRPYNYQEFLMDEDGGIRLFHAKIQFDEAGENLTEVWVGKDLKSNDMEPIDFGMAEINKLRFTPKCYIVYRTITRKSTDPVTGIITEAQATEFLKNWTDIDLANNDAVKEFIEYIRPPIDLGDLQPGDTDRLERFDNEICPQVRRLRDQLEYGDCYVVELERDELVDEGVSWLDKDIVCVVFGVIKYSMKGPLN
ncbi:hypothetical protein HYALB_00002827 [Hymenoscyphus albidus]|uniref:Uncharacterized protein n=1 Tax=Hymenoscyphus albidus TaxID=595503 RepID=A0A9N9Q3L2_9HELO|nr:hypothetical protein HYALB_00002827 [Hymenoscyphus albidus]